MCAALLLAASLIAQTSATPPRHRTLLGLCKSWLAGSDYVWA
jgi:hypothetical protein